MRGSLWAVLLALLVGAGLGVAYTWVLAPRSITDASPLSLRDDFKDQYRAAIAAAYAATGNLPRAQARLTLVGDPDPVQALNAQAQRMRAGSAGGGFGHADQVAALASALNGDSSGAPVRTLTPETEEPVAIERTATVNPLELTDEVISDETPAEPETGEIVETLPAETLIPPTPRPAHTFTPEPGEPFALVGEETVCDPNLPDGLLQVLVLNRSRRQLPGIEILITWDSGSERFFTGLKPELGNGYADYLMSPSNIYTVQLASGSDVALGLTSPTCQNPDGETFSGSIKLTFQQP
ncbi:MAG TPA: hypothetical protein VK900_12525 [Anaerolineales bacterium]|nr:hypothetical protein [Anaerolineales bacterium]